MTTKACAMVFALKSEHRLAPKGTGVGNRFYRSEIQSTRALATHSATKVNMTEQAPSIFEMENVSKSYGDKLAVARVSLSLQKGEFLSIIGPSGGGKSTILKMMSGVILPSDGSLRFQGENLSTISAGDHRMVMVWQSLALFPHMNVEGNVGFGLSVRKVPRTEQKRRIADSLDLVGLAGYQRRHVQDLSGGEQQRVALARALVVAPELIMLDEPFGALDVHLRARLLEKIREIHHTTGLTFVMVTHDQAEALYVSTRIAVLNHGHLEQIGRPVEILQEPSTAFVASFVGRKNVLDAVVESVSGSEIRVSTSAGSFSCKAPSWVSMQYCKGMRIAYVIEAHRIEVAGNGENQVSGLIEGRVLDGSREILDIDVDGFGTIKCEHANTVGEEVDWSHRIDLSWRTQDAYVLPHFNA